MIERLIRYKTRDRAIEGATMMVVRSEQRLIVFTTGRSNIVCRLTSVRSPAKKPVETNPPETPAFLCYSQ